MNELSTLYAPEPISPVAVTLVLTFVMAVSVYYLVKAFKFRATGTTSDDPMEQHLGIQISGYLAIIAACAWSLVSTMTGAW